MPPSAVRGSHGSPGLEREDRVGALRGQPLAAGIGEPAWGCEHGNEWQRRGAAPLQPGPEQPASAQGAEGAQSAQTAGRQIFEGQ